MAEFAEIPEEYKDCRYEEECVTLHQRKWADGAAKTAVRAVCQFIHINTAAPFGTFRAKI